MTAGEILSTYNLVTTGNVSTNSDVEGSSIIGGSLNGASFFNNSGDLPHLPAIYVYGSSISGNMNLDNGGSLYYAGNLNSERVNFNGGGKLVTTLPNSLSSFTTPLTSLSTQLAKLAPTAGTSLVNGDFIAPVGMKGLVVFDFAAATLESDLQNTQITFSGGKGVTGFIINVSGNFSEPNGVNFNTPQRDALFNFDTATTVSLGNWKTSVLAPDANLNILNGYLAGSVFAKSFSGGGELHNDNLYDGALPTSGVPEPSTWAMMLLGFVGMGAAAFLRNRKAGAALTA